MMLQWMQHLTLLSIVWRTAEDVKYASLLGYSIKLIGYLKDMDEKKSGTICSVVAPMFVEKSCPLSDVNGVFNGILVTGDSVGDVMFYGRGAGKLPTASAVVADIIDIISNKDTQPKPIEWKTASDKDMADFETYTCRRMFILNCSKTSLPDAFNGNEIKEVDGVCGILTNEMSEKEASALANSLQDKLLAVYRTL